MRVCSCVLIKLREITTFIGRLGGDEMGGQAGLVSIASSKFYSSFSILLFGGTAGATVWR